MKPSKATMLLTLLLGLSACLTPVREQELGDAQAREIERQVGLVRDPMLRGYVRAVGMRLAAASERPTSPWSFEIARSPEPNAFSLPGGHVYVTRGLLVLVNSEDELAGVLGHEIAHVTARHSLKRLRAALLTAPVSLASAVAGLAAGIVSPLLRDAVVGTGRVLTGGLVLAPYSRAQEREADAIGQALAASAGYDPAGLPAFLHTLERDTHLRRADTARPHFLDGHPLTAERIEESKARAKMLSPAPGAPIAATRAALYQILDGLLVGPDPAQGLFVGTLFVHPDLDLRIAFPAGWRTLNTPETAGAVSPDREALVALRLVAAGTSLDAVLEQSARADRSLVFERGTVHGLPAAWGRHTSGGQVADITLIAFRGDVLAVVGQCAASKIDAYGPVFARTARSLRALLPEERRAIRVSRLRLRRAHAGETAAQVVARTGSSWSAAQLEVANALEAGAQLAEGQPLKVALPAPYLPQAHEAPARP